MDAINEVKMLAAKKGLTLTYIAKYLSEEKKEELRSMLSLKAGDVLFFISDAPRAVNNNGTVYAIA